MAAKMHQGQKQMSANPLELFMTQAGTGTRPEVAALPLERRRRARTRVHWQVLLFRNQAAEAIASTTQDLSSSGFFCITAIPLIPGEVLTCALKVPAHDPNGKHLERNLECKVRVVRVAPQQQESAFGIACHIEDYRFVDLVYSMAKRANP